MPTQTQRGTTMTGTDAGRNRQTHRDQRHRHRQRQTDKQIDRQTAIKRCSLPLLYSPFWNRPLEVQTNVPTFGPDLCLLLVDCTYLMTVIRCRRLELYCLLVKCCGPLYCCTRLFGIDPLKSKQVYPRSAPIRATLGHPKFRLWLRNASPPGKKLLQHEEKIAISRLKGRQVASRQPQRNSMRALQ